MTSFVLRTSPSGPLIEGVNQDDVLLWDVATKRWIPGPGGGGGAVSSVFGRAGAVVAVAGDYDASEVNNDSGVSGATVADALDALSAAIPTDASQITNDSGVSGATVKDALDTLQASSTKLATGANLTNADQTLATSQRYVMPAGTTTATRTKTLTPSGTAARGFQIEIGTQGNDVIVQNGGPGGTAGLFSFTVTAGQRYALFFISDGTDVSVTAAMPLAVEPQP